MAFDQLHIMRGGQERCHFEFIAKGISHIVHYNMTNTSSPNLFGYSVHVSVVCPNPFSSLFTRPFSAIAGLCSISPTFSIILPTVESLFSSKLPVLLPKPAPPVEPLPCGVALLYGAVSVWEPKRVDSVSADSEVEKEERLLPVGGVVSKIVIYYDVEEDLRDSGVNISKCN